ncbi:Fe(3+) ABC transporter substrate-binding protein [Arenicella xantha]|uniref:Iron(III) transport system substrate-binding protein n=1 Tax=Arenicella xantha TaxID=644221 RepID=A0A395JHM2_9GAMM|nr:Fe(3+) ABC transporter substrate-binding protein [Arenicella xantha]RBP49637.1 iron(III) transport system substrate-binding protein [Arenicella xantha]
MKTILALTTALLLSACSPQNAEVNLYSARKEALIKPLLDAFTAETGITVNIISGKDDALLERIKSEGLNSPADLLITTDAGRLHRAKQAGIFTAVDSAILKQNIPANYRDSDDAWFGLSVRARPIMVTNAKPNIEISRYEDLTNPALQQQICIRSSDNIYNQSLVASMLAASTNTEVEGWVSGLVANFARPPQGGDRDQIRAAAAGQCSVVVANTYYLANMLADKANQADFNAASAMTVIWPNQQDRGTHVNVSGAGLINTAPNKENGIKLIEFLASDTAQKMYADVNFEYPVKEGVELNPILASWGPFKADALSLDMLGKNNADAVKVMDRAGWK